MPSIAELHIRASARSGRFIANRSRHARQSFVLFAAAALGVIALGDGTAVVGAQFADPTNVSFVHELKLTPSDGAEDDGFGTSVAVDGDTIVVGAPGANIGSNENQGAAYVFTRSPGGGGHSIEIAKLIASDGGEHDTFGRSVAMHGDTIVVGAPNATTGSGDFIFAGAVYVFTRPEGGWINTTETAKLTATPLEPFFSVGVGFSVAISGDTVVAGTPFAEGPSDAEGGAVYIFARPAGGWVSGNETVRLTPPDSQSFGRFGDSVAAAGDTVLVGSRGASSPPDSFDAQGAAYVFVRPDDGWDATVEMAKLTASDAAPGDNLGVSVALAEGTAVVGAPFADGSQANQGAVYVFRPSNEGWVDSHEAAKLTASDGGLNDHLGSSVAVLGRAIAAGADLADVAPNADQGAAYVFRRRGRGWASGTETAKVTASDAIAEDGFGFSIALGPTTLAVGAPFADVGGNTNSGAAYVFPLRWLHRR